MCEEGSSTGGSSHDSVSAVVLGLLLHGEAVGVHNKFECLFTRSPILVIGLSKPISAQSAVGNSSSAPCGIGAQCPPFAESSPFQLKNRQGWPREKMPTSCRARQLCGYSPQCPAGDRVAMGGTSPHTLSASQLRSCNGPKIGAEKLRPENVAFIWPMSGGVLRLSLRQSALALARLL